MGKLSNTTQEIDEALQSVRKVLGDDNFYRNVTTPPVSFFANTGTDKLTAMAKDFWETNQAIQEDGQPFKNIVNGSPIMGVLNYASLAYDWVKEHSLLLTIQGNKEWDESYLLTKYKPLNGVEYTASNTQYPDLLEYKTFLARIEGAEYQIIRFTRYNNENVFYSSPSYVRAAKGLRCYKLTYNDTAATLAERFVIEPVKTGDQGVEVSININMNRPADSNVNRWRTGDIANKDLISKPLPRGGYAVVAGDELGHVIANIAVTIDGKSNKIYSYMSWIELGNSDYQWKSQPFMLAGKMYVVSFVEHTAQVGHNGWFTDVTLTEITSGHLAQFTENEKAVLDSVIAENSVKESRYNGNVSSHMSMDMVLQASNQTYFSPPGFANIATSVYIGNRVYVNIATAEMQDKYPWLRIITYEQESGNLDVLYSEPYFHRGEYYTMKITSDGSNVKVNFLKLTDSAKEDIEVDLGSITSTSGSSSTSGVPFSSLRESRYRLKAKTSNNSAIYLSMYAATDNWLVTTPYNGRAILVTKYANSDNWMRRSYTLAEINTQTGVTVFPGSGGLSGM